jgi:hypothetical protein
MPAELVWADSREEAQVAVVVVVVRGQVATDRQEQARVQGLAEQEHRQGEEARGEENFETSPPAARCDLDCGLLDHRGDGAGIGGNG